MAKAAKIEFVCTECGMNYQRWQGQCRCGAWNTLAEFKPYAGQSRKAATRAVVGGYAGGVGGGSKLVRSIIASYCRIDRINHIDNSRIGDHSYTAIASNY